MAKNKKPADAAKDKAAKQKKLAIGLVCLLALAMAADLLLQLVHRVLEVGALAPHGLVGHGCLDQQPVDVGTAVPEQPAPGSFVSQLCR